ncbi:hypothetical protein GCM10008956_32340 [Deinococcus arenae]|uniref:AAA+ ATPase domain-containing protein n=1 Tax=Deinococcus arenae TaxID=1452751 RepID=A0A8H9L884_9DEIO|nr:AAA family ATPase [Deinococcus arenae]GGM53964.1 hypothetical protein GCM10008956_32340 [Deinococcus arenae]
MRLPDLNRLEQAAAHLALVAHPPRLNLRDLPALLDPPLLREAQAHPNRFRLMARRSGLQIIPEAPEGRVTAPLNRWAGLDETCVLFWALHQLLREAAVPGGPGLLRLLLWEAGATSRQPTHALTVLHYVLLSEGHAAADLTALEGYRLLRFSGTHLPDPLAQVVGHLAARLCTLSGQPLDLGLTLLARLGQTLAQVLTVRLPAFTPTLFPAPGVWRGDRLTDPAAALEASGTPLPAPLTWTWLQTQLNGPAEPVQPPAPPQDALGELASLPGLSGPAETLRALIRAAAVQRRRESLGMRPLPLTLHAAFVGHPGTGKTTAARLYARALHEGGLLGSDQLVEVERADLIGGYLGQSALKVQGCLDRAMDGTLLIDEAYSLTSVDGPDHYAQEAIDTLVRGMEERRSRLAVLLTGYPEEMERLFQANPGLRSRVTRVITFPEHDPATLMAILLRLARDHDYRLTPAAQRALLTHIQRLHAQGGLRQGNARLIRTLLEQMITGQAGRLHRSGAWLRGPTQLLNLLEEDDLPGPVMSAPSLLA